MKLTFAFLQFDQGPQWHHMQGQADMQAEPDRSGGSYPGGRKGSHARQAPEALHLGCLAVHLWPGLAQVSTLLVTDTIDPLLYTGQWLCLRMSALAIRVRMYLYPTTQLRSESNQIRNIVPALGPLPQEQWPWLLMQVRAQLRLWLQLPSASALHGSLSWSRACPLGNPRHPC